MTPTHQALFCGILRRLVAVLALAAWLCLPHPGLAQTPATGPVVDATGAIVPAAREKPPVPAGGGPGLRPVAGGKSGGGSSGSGTAVGALDYTAWERMAGRAEAAIETQDSTESALEFLRRQLVDWREALLGAQSANAARIATLRNQVTALGPLPAEGVTEPEEIAKRRAALSEQLVRLQAPGIAAEEAYRRADGLISEIDRVLRERKADAMLRHWPVPINPANWPAALGALSKLAMTLWGETASVGPTLPRAAS